MTRTTISSDDDERKKRYLIEEINKFYKDMIYKYGLPRDRNLLNDVALKFIA